MSVDTKERFGFGKNWEEFVKTNYNPERAKIARDHLLSFLRLPDLKGKSFLDIGCGSGLHALAAFQSGASSITCMDYDQDSVNTTLHIREMNGAPENWTARQGSVLDEKFMRSLPQADIVYSWGVLHHTGDLWTALRQAAFPMKENSVFYIALYADEVYQNPPASYWVKTKKAYNLAGNLKKRLMEYSYAWRFVLKSEVMRGRNPFRIIREYKQSRGMEFWTDVRDWLGGWPMEFSNAKDVIAFCEKESKLELISINAGEGCTEFLFRKKGARNYWDELMAGKKIEKLTGPFAQAGGYCWSANLPQYAQEADDAAHPKRSKIEVLENGKLLLYHHWQHEHIRKQGQGRYSHWQDKLLFSTSDNSDPNTNGREYQIRFI